MSFGSHHNEEPRSDKILVFFALGKFGKVNVLTGNANSKTSGNITSPSTVFFRSHQYEEAKRPEISPRVPDKSSPPAHQANLSPQDRFKMVDYSDIYDSREDASTKYSNSRAPKRNRSPQQLSTAVLGMSPVQLDPDREMLAKARRLARFSVELSQPTETLQSAKHHARESKHNRASLDKMETDKLTESRSLSIKDNFSEMGSLEFSSAVVGLCQDMCPESEREERERKGDLDKYERLDGERNQTSEYLAVKKYNRTAEREADLIRPMPVLQKTMDYLLNLLNQPYNEDFLNIYNFLWDRMRAIRMDLRMQHYFNHQAITMLEQMIRLHIVAMHELCEYNKGEGFSEGFDAHLNIEQMNKASVELFQMYDDHRKKGIYVPTEKEFRGYYALLKLDKHPGYKVEPAELSLDLAKMTPAIRCTPQILFARDVARACRIGNYIAFFRLARKATYLQACLMHAHFAKLRRHALASLYSSLPSSLQNNRGIPVTDVIDWLGLEDEDVESLLEYHGFVLKKFEEAFMVKEGPFLNSDTDFPTKRSQLVHLKRSQVIIHDIYSDPTSSRYSEKIDMKSQKSILNIKSGPIISVFPEKQETRPNEFEMFEADASETDTLQVASNDVIHDLEADTVVGTIIQSQNFFDMQTPFLISEIEVQAPEVFKPHDTSVANDHVQQNEDEQVVESERETYMDRGLSPKKPCADIVGYVAPVSSPMNASINNSSPQVEINREHENKEHLHLHVLYQKKQVADEKLIMFFRKWKRVAKRSRESREQRIMLANAAFNSLSVGAPVVRPYKALSRAAINELNISDTATKRYEKQSKSWSTINVAELVAPVLSSWNPDAKCLCWKLLVLVQPSVNEGVTNYVSSRWLLSKLMCSSKENDTPIVSVPHLSIWRSWINTQLGSFYNCCLAIIREATFVNNDISDDDAVTGASSVIFHVSENIPWEIQKMRLHNVLSRIPTGSNIPLLIVSGDAYTEETIDPSSTIIRRLGLHDIELTTISSFLVVFLYDSDTEENHSGFFKDDQLRMGLLWLANYSPLQPSISLMKTREVVSFYLISATEILEYADTSNFGPNQCISIFNAALDRLVQEIYGAASLNVNHWPSPEVDLLEKSSYEHAFVDMYLPSVGWSLPCKIQPLLEAIKGCKLPEFSNDISWLKKGSYMGLKIPDQKIALEECLISYMTESCQMLGSDLAAREARIMVQTGADLELCGSYYYIVPRWLVIFRRIQNWRLKNLTTGLGTVAYLLEQHQDSLPEIDNVQRISAYTPYLEKANSEKLGLMHSFTTKLSFDEIAEVLNYEVPLTEQSITLQEPSSSIPVVDGGGEAPKTDNLVKNNDAEPKYSSSRTGELQLAITLPKMDDRLAMLLEKVTKHQDRIDKQLSLYF